MSSTETTAEGVRFTEGTRITRTHIEVLAAYIKIMTGKLVEAKDEAKDDYIAELVETRTKFDRLKDEKHTLELDNNELSKKNHALETKLESANKYLKEYKDSIWKLVEKNTVLSNRAEALSDRSKELDTKFAEIVSRNAELFGKNKELHNKNMDLEAKCTRLETRNKRQYDRICELGKELVSQGGSELSPIVSTEDGLESSVVTNSKITQPKHTKLASLSDSDIIKLLESHGVDATNRAMFSFARALIYLSLD